jgi:periplasmic glucans biosynthesis protein
VDRRQFVAGAALLPLLRASAAAQISPFSAQTVRDIAREAAAKPFVAADNKLPDVLRNLTYDKYRMLRFRPEYSLWRQEKLPFEMQMFHRGFLYSDKVEIFEVANGQATPVPYAQEWFDFADIPPPQKTTGFGFAGFRIHAPINRGDYHDEVCAFLGASYFRAVAKGQQYGLSARGLALNTGEASGEEFPAFRAFWLEKPRANATSIVVHALLDSKSTTAAFRFTIRPGETTVFDTEMAIYPRTELKNAGLAPMTSMFLFGPNDRTGIDDFRPAVHDSDGLAILNGRGEQLWRPLSNPRDLQISHFGDHNPRGFGLIQRQREFAAYQDIESRFELRPSIWIEPIGDWGEGDVRLIEIPSNEEVHDNIAGFWRPKEPLKSNAEHTFTYRINWAAAPINPPPLARFTRTAIGAKGDKKRLFVLDLAGDKLKDVDAKAVRGVVAVQDVQVENVVTQPNPITGGWRLSFEFATPTKPTEMRATVMQGEKPLSEVWVYRWTP